MFSIDNCRVCNNPLFNEPLLVYENMPGAAQYMPSEYTLKDDYSVDLKICQCSGCGLVQLNNDPVPYYKEVIRATSFSNEMTAFRRKHFKNFVEKNKLKNKKIVEIGCGTGHYLSILSDFDVDARGFEFARDSVEICRKKGLKVEMDFIDNSSRMLKGGPFEAFMIMSFLEHQPHPNKMLGGIYHNLTPGGIGLVEVPNFDMIIENNLFAEFIGDHLLYFTKETLERTLEINGFDVIYSQSVWYDYILSMVVKKREEHNLSNFIIRKEKVRKEITDFVKRYNENSVAIWGAGHQSLAIMSIVDLGKKIKYVVDSATFKQGRFTPATHIPIVEPDRLKLDPPKAVIVMAASYSDEVGRIINEKYNGLFDVAIHRNYGLEII